MNNGDDAERNAIRMYAISVISPRCRSCEKRISYFPTIISLLVELDFIGARQIDALACTSSMLRKFISVDSDEELWSSFLRSKWPITTEIPRRIFSRMSNRSWYERLQPSALSGSGQLGDDINGNCEEEFISKV